MHAQNGSGAVSGIEGVPLVYGHYPTSLLPHQLNFYPGQRLISSEIRRAALRTNYQPATGYPRFFVNEKAFRNMLAPQSLQLMKAVVHS